tara:strand:+ start:269 stop:982 length:714 start_codon:yes stop_codon:yes gene_type:complete
MNILPRKKNVMLNVKVVEPPKPPSPKVDLKEEVEEESEEEVLAGPTNGEVFNEVEDEPVRPVAVPPTNVIEADPTPVKKKKRKLSEKQLAHLAKMRAAALAKRKKLKEQKEAEKAKKRAIKEKKRLEREAMLEKRRIKREAREAQKAQAKQEAQQVANPSPSLSQQDQEFSKFFNYMERYDRIKAVRKRQNARTYTSNNLQSNKASQPTNRGKTQSLQTPHTLQQPKNPYLGSLIPF